MKTREATHTPGPWIMPLKPDGTVEMDDAEQCLLIKAEDDQGEWTLAKVNLCMGSESEANAHLIKAAPDLLGFVERFSNLLGTPKAKLMDELFAEANRLVKHAKGAL